MFAAIFAVLIGVSSPTRADVFVSVHIAPPALPVYVQPVIPGPGYIWQPGYWAYGPAGYYWVPGTWVLPPRVGLLWTPGYWGWADGAYVWHVGYWGPRVGFYGGVVYGFGYVGTGYFGGYWNNGVFMYNRTVNNVTVVENIYTKTVINNTTVHNVSYNGGTGGTTAQPTAEERAATKDAHIPPTAAQAQHEHAASGNHTLLASVNHGRPAVAATARAGTFHGPGIVSARAMDAPMGHPHGPPAREASAGHPHGAPLKEPRRKASSPKPEHEAHERDEPLR
jgi:hypothetical protein